MEIGEFLWVSGDGDWCVLVDFLWWRSIEFLGSRSVCCGGGLWMMGFGMDRHGGVGRG